MQIENWFPTTIIFDNFDSIDINKYQILVDEQVEKYPEANSTGHWSGFNNHFLVNLHLNKDYSDLVVEIKKLIEHYINTLGWDTQSQIFKLDRMWANSYQSKETTRKHFHSGVLSGCFYLDQGHEIVFYNPLLNNRPEQLHTQVWTKEQNYLNTNSITYKSEPGKCLIWPAPMMHETKKIDTNVTRSIAFDVWCYSNKNHYFPKIT